MKTRIASILSALAVGLMLWTSGPSVGDGGSADVVAEGGQWGGPKGGGRVGG